MLHHNFLLSFQWFCQPTRSKKKPKSNPNIDIFVYFFQLFIKNVSRGLRIAFSNITKPEVVCWLLSVLPNISPILLRWFLCNFEFSTECPNLVYIYISKGVLLWKKEKINKFCHDFLTMVTLFICRKTNAIGFSRSQNTIFHFRPIRD